MRDMGSVEAALNAPRWVVDHTYLHSFPYGMAAAYLFFLCKNHGFNDANKRISLFAALTFLRMNGLTCTASQEELVQLVVDVADNKRDKLVVKQFFETSARTEEPVCDFDTAKTIIQVAFSSVFGELAHK